MVVKNPTVVQPVPRWVVGLRQQQSFDHRQTFVRELCKSAVEANTPNVVVLRLVDTDVDDFDTSRVFGGQTRDAAGTAAVVEVSGQHGRTVRTGAVGLRNRNPVVGDQRRATVSRNLLPAGQRVDIGWICATQRSQQAEVFPLQTAMQGNPVHLTVLVGDKVDDLIHQLERQARPVRTGVDGLTRRAQGQQTRELVGSTSAVDEHVLVLATHALGLRRNLRGRLVRLVGPSRLDQAVDFRVTEDGGQAGSNRGEGRRRVGRDAGINRADLHVAEDRFTGVLQSIARDAVEWQQLEHFVHRNRILNYTTDEQVPSEFGTFGQGYRGHVLFSR